MPFVRDGTPERVLITGGAGFIGYHLAESHLASGDEVHVLVRPGSPAQSRQTRYGIARHEVDMTDLAAMRRCLIQARPTLLYHLASGTGRDPGIPEPARLPETTRDVDNLIVLLAAAAESPSLRVLIRAGSLAEYGSSSVAAREIQRERPRTVYTTAMVAGAHYCAMVQPQLHFPVLTARLALTYGPGQSESFLLPWLLRRCLAGDTATVHHPEARRDMVFVDDIVEGLRAMALAEIAGGTIINLSSGSALKVRDLVALVMRITGTRADRVKIAPLEESDLRVDILCGAPDRAATLLGWHARTGIEEGIVRTLQSIEALAA